MPGKEAVRPTKAAGRPLAELLLTEDREFGGVVSGVVVAVGV